MATLRDFAVQLTREDYLAVRKFPPQAVRGHEQTGSLGPPVARGNWAGVQASSSTMPPGLSARSTKGWSRARTTPGE